MGLFNSDVDGILLFCTSVATLRLIHVIAGSGLLRCSVVSKSESTSPSHEISSLPYIARQATLEGGTPPDQVRFEYDNSMNESATLARARAFARLQNQRRSMRFFDPTIPVTESLLNACIETAGTAPSGAHQQPWHFCVVRDPATKAAIRTVVEREEQLNYDKRMKQSWKNDLEPIFRNSALHQGGLIEKPYLTQAPCLVVVTELTHGIHPDTGERLTHHYVKEGVGIAVGLFLSALTNVGLFSLTSTPLNAGGAICALLDRPSNEKVFLLMPLGFPAQDATVPYRCNPGQPGTSLRKTLSEISTSY